MLNRGWLIPSVVTLAGCQTLILGSEIGTQKQTVSAGPTQAPNASPTPIVSAGASDSLTPEDAIRFFIVGKRTSNLSLDRKTITLSVDAADATGAPLKIEWSQEGSYGSLNTDRGQDVQWTVTRPGTFVAKLKVTVSSTVKTDEPDIAWFSIPVVNGTIGATEIPPEISIAPQSIYLFRPLPTELNLSEQEQERLGIRLSSQLTATTYIYDAQTNTKVKSSGNFDEIVWTSRDASLVVVDENGLIKAADGSATGSTVVTAASKTNSGSKAATVVNVAYLDTEINLSYPTTTIYKSGQSPTTVKLSASVDYKNPADRGRVVYTDTSGKDLTWRSANPAVAQVDTAGNVSALADASTGDVVITARSKYDPAVTATVSIKVR